MIRMKKLGSWLMLNSKHIRCLIITSYMLIIAGCATSGNEKTEHTNENRITKNEQTNPSVINANSEFDTDNTTSAALNILDPMKAVILPLSLIQGYDEVSNLILQKKTQQATVKLNQLQLQHPEFSGPSYRLARINQQQENSSGAMAAINIAIKINPKNYYALNLKGLLLRENVEFEGSKQAYLEAIKVYPSHSNSQLNLAILADIYLYDFELALKHYEKYKRLILKTENCADCSAKRQKKVTGWIADLKRRMPKGDAK